MFGDSQTTLNIVLAIAVTLLTVFLCVTLIYLILRDVSKMLEKVRETVDRINNFILKPVSLASTIVDHVRPMIEAALERRAEANEREHKKRK